MTAEIVGTIEEHPFPPRVGRVVEKRAREKSRAAAHRDCAQNASADFSSERAELTQEYLPYCKEVLQVMRENLQADCVQSRRRSLRDAAQGRGENKHL